MLHFIFKKKNKTYTHACEREKKIIETKSTEEKKLNKNKQKIKNKTKQKRSREKHFMTSQKKIQNLANRPLKKVQIK